MGWTSQKVAPITAKLTQQAPIINEDEVDEVAALPERHIAGDSDLMSLIELSFKCNNLPNLDRFSQTDAFVVLYVEEQKDNWKEKGRTEIVFNDLNPQFVTSFKLNYCFEESKPWRVDIYDAVKFTEKVMQLHRQTLIGIITFNIHEVVCANNSVLTRDIRNPKVIRQTHGSVTITAEQMKRQNHQITLKFAIESSMSKRLLLRISREKEQTDVGIPVYLSEVCNKTKEWEEFTINVDTLWRGDAYRRIIIEVLKYEKRKAHHVEGIVNTNLSELQHKKGMWSHKIENNGRGIGRLYLKKYYYNEKASFLDYIYGGCEVSLIVGIDFTRSNGVPSEQTSLHYIDDNNEYIQAIRAVGEILQYYDTDKQIPAYGFGAKLNEFEGIVSQCFAINGNIFDPEVDNVEGVVNAYKKVMPNLTFHGPTVFSKIIRMASDYASAKASSQAEQQYYILLILTDGIINDMEVAIDEIVAASELPLSIIIVGIGKENFDMMDRLDADDAPLVSQKTGKSMSRDIVQFVPFSKFKGFPHELAKEVLYEVPEQLLGYMESVGLKPNKESDNIFSTTLSKRFSSFENLDLASSQTLVPFKTPPVAQGNENIFLRNLKTKYINDIVALGYDRAIVIELIDQGIPCADINLAVAKLNQMNKNKPKIKSAMKRSKTEGHTRFTKGHVQLPPMEINSIDFDEHPELDARICKVWYAEFIDIVLLEWGHRVVCQKCVQQIGKVCPSCRAPIVRWIRTYNG